MKHLPRMNGHWRWHCGLPVMLLSIAALILLYRSISRVFKRKGNCFGKCGIIFFREYNPEIGFWFRAVIVVLTSCYA